MKELLIKRGGGGGGGEDGDQEKSQYLKKYISCELHTNCLNVSIMMPLEQQRLWKF